MTTPTNIHDALLESAEQYQHSVTPQAVLEPYKDAILLLRAKHASYEKITDTLTMHGVQISVSTVRKFCLRYHTELERRRAVIEVERGAVVAGEKSSPAPSVAAPPSSEHSPPAFGIGKRSSRIARDKL